MSSTHIKVTPAQACAKRRSGEHEEGRRRPHMNKKQRTAKGDTTSVFAENWKKWVFTSTFTKIRRDLKAKADRLGIGKRRKVKAYGR